VNRAEHLEWCKQRAIPYAQAGQYQQALASLASDLDKHPETQGHPAGILGLGMLMSGGFHSPAEMIKFINDCR